MLCMNSYKQAYINECGANMEKTAGGLPEIARRRQSKSRVSF
jgi:hypothetical protein